MAASSAPAASQRRQVLEVAARARGKAGMADVGGAEAARQALARRFRDNTGFRAPAIAPARAVPSLCFRPVFPCVPCRPRRALLPRPAGH
ncbi:hypothetical protein CBM2634_A40037 [Cupriavidus taiwanensis]|uniref:Uncharacterized protein n=1 Tax=Cupriavidus taiwanensis TaxID=164546 RepID=A0A375J514_9BURK|nr:hypothetical protein CBM2634_A40037 [Cupriavidus taiwanensis]